MCAYEICLKFNYKRGVFMGILHSLFGNYSKRELKRIQPIADSVLELEDKYQKWMTKNLSPKQIF